MADTYHSLASGDFSQDWSDSGLITANDDWSGVASIVGYRGDDVTSAVAADPQTLTSDGTLTVDVNANQTNPAAFATGGVAEFALADPTIALTGSGTADAPSIVIHLDATGREDVTVSYRLRDLDGSADNAVQPVALQYRVGATGAWTNVPAGFVADATTGPSLASQETTVSATLPAAVNNQSQVQVRVITSNATGNDEWVGVDDILVTSQPAGQAAAGITVVQSGGSTSVTEGGATDTLSLVLNTQPTADVTITLTPDAQTTVTPVSLTFTAANWNVAQTVTVAAVDDAVDEQPNAHSSTLSFGVTSADAAYAALVPADLSVAVQDNEVTLVRISTIQGTPDTQLANAYTADAGTVDAFDGSPLKGQIVTVEAIVVGDFQTGDTDASRDLQGFYIQEEDADGDGNALSSEGIFVFDPNFLANVQIGDKVRITGRVDEFFGETQLNVGTSVSGSSIQIVSSGNTLPTAAVITLPAADVTESQDNKFQPDLEAYEGMRVTVTDTLTVTEQFQLDRFNEIKLFATEGFEQTGPDGTTITGERPFTYTQYNDPDAAGNAAYLRELGARTLTYDDGLNTQNQPISGLDGFEGYTTATAPRMGDTITGLTGVLDYKFAGNAASGSTWRVRAVVEGENTFQSETPRPPETVTVGGTLKVASFNVLNFFTTLNVAGTADVTEVGQEPRGANNASELARQTDKLVDAILGLNADIIGLIEIENDFIDPSGQTTPIQSLVDALNAVAGAGTYAYVNPGEDQVGGDAIAVAMLYRTASVQVAPGTAPAILTDAQVAQAILDRSDVDNDPNTAGGNVFTGANTSRSPLAVTFQELGGNQELLTVVVNHTKSKSGIGTGDDADAGDGAGNWNNQRQLAVEALTAWLETNPTGSTTPNQLLIGDFNAYAEESPIDYLTDTAGFVDIAAELLDLAYSYLFDAAHGTLDYAFASLELFNQVVAALEWHINSDEADALDYNTDFGRDPAIFDGDSPVRASDHDPVVVGFTLDSVDPLLTAATPANDATEVAADANIVLTFSEVVRAGVGNITLTNGAGDTRVIASTDAQVAFDGTKVTINPATDLVAGTTYDVLIDNGAIADAAGNAFAGLAQDQQEFTVAASTYKLQILHASDFEAGLDAVDRAGNFAAIVDYLEDTQENSITLSSGDNYLPSPFFNAGSEGSLKEVYETALEDHFNLATGTLNITPGFGTADISMLNIIGLDASAIGNHEFDAGTNPFAAIMRQTAGYPGVQFPYLSANINFSGDSNLNPLFSSTVRSSSDYTGFPPAAGNTNKIAPATIITEGGERIGVVGATTQVVESISSTGGIDIIGVDANDMVALAAVLQPTIDALIAQGINKIVLVSHLQQIAFEKQLAGLLRGVDVIVAGGSNTLLADAEDVSRGLRPGDAAAETYPFVTTDADGNTTLVVNTEGEYSYVGRLVVEFDANGEIILDSLDENVNGAFATTDAGVAALYATPIDIDGDGDLDSDAFASGTKGDLVNDIAQAVGAVIDAQDGNLFGATDVYLEGRRGETRTEETNLGNLSADANLWYAQQSDATVLVSIKNGGGIRDSIGVVEAVGADVTERPPLANPEVGKEAGEVSQLDIANALRFNNALSLITLTPAQLKMVLEHGVAAVAPGATPGQFAQVGGISFSYDPTAQAQVINGSGTVTQVGQRIKSAVIVDADGNEIVLIENGQVVDTAPAAIRVVTLSFLVTGGDNYPFRFFVAENAAFANRVDLDPDNTSNDDVATRTGVATFTDNGFEQDALAEYLAAFHSETPYAEVDGTPATDERIQNLAQRADTVLANDAPITGDDAGSAGENERKSFDLLANDLDPEGDDLTLQGFQVTAVAGVALTNAAAAALFSIVDNELAFTPGTAFDALAAGQTATVTLSYTASDGALASAGEFVLTVEGRAEPVVVNGSGRADQLFGGAQEDQINAQAGNDRAFGGAGDDVIDGGAGNDNLYGDAGGDTVLGGDGNDLAFGGTGNDDLQGGAGNDTMNGEAGNDILSGGANRDLLSGGAGEDTLFGGTEADKLNGQDGADFLSGDGGKDEVFGGSGDDTLAGGDQNDLLFGDADNDVVSGGAGKDGVYGGSGNDTLSGGIGNDTIQGDAGDDLIAGGANNDRLFGGAGVDTFVFETGGGRDEIMDFVLTGPSADLIQIDITQYEDFADLLANGVTEAGRSVYLDYADGSRMFLTRVDIDDLTADQFVFV